MNQIAIGGACRAGLAAKRSETKSESTSVGENARGNASVTSSVTVTPNESVTGIEVESVTRIGIRREGELIHLTE